MCIASTALQYLSTGAQAGGGLLKAIGQRRQASALASQERNNAGVLDRNAQISDDLAIDARARGKLNVNRSKSAGRSLKGKQRAAFAANGIDVGSGAVVNTLRDTDLAIEVDAMTISENAMREAKGFEQQAENERTQADFARTRAGNAKKAGRFAVFNTVLGTTGTVASSWYKYRYRRRTTRGIV